MQVLAGSTKNYKKGQYIFKEGDEGKKMLIISEGVVKILRQRSNQTTILTRLKKDDFFGEMSVFTGLNRSACAQAETDCKIIEIDKETFLNLVESPVVWRILQKMSDRILEFDDKVSDLLVEDELAKVVQLFRRYVSPQIVDNIMHKAEHKDLDLSGELRKVTVLFADIRNFTSIAEKLAPHKVVELLNNYLGQMTQIVFKYDGTVDKYIGDCIMAIFNAPVEQKDHELLAVSAGWSIIQKISEIKEDNLDISVGVGINTGKAVIGNIGTDLHLDYTAIGDAVNVSSRLCRIAPPGELLISEDTYNVIKDKVEVEEKGFKTFKGKTKPIGTYKVTNIKN